MESYTNFEKNPKILKDFLNYLYGIKNYSLNTIRNYNISLLMFFDFLKVYRDIPVKVEEFNYFILSSVKEYEIIAFLVFLNNIRENEPRTRQSRLCAIRRFYKWLFETYPIGDFKVNPAMNIENLGRIVRVPKYLSLENAKKIQKIFNISNSRNPIRDNAILTTFLSTGMRVGELTRIRLSDINFNNNTIMVLNDKTHKDRTVYFSNSCKKVLQEYIHLKTRKLEVVNINDYLFSHSGNKKLSCDAIRFICKKAYNLLGLKDYGYTTHTLRHTAATMMYMYSGQDLLLVKKFLGHARLSSTEIYAHTSSERVRNAVNANPLNKIFEEKNVKKNIG